jgi:hypothetical protein
MPYGIRPSGAKIDLLANPGTMWEVFAKLAESAERAAARIYLGTDGVLGAQGGAPGVDVSALFGVATSKTQSDIMCIGNGLDSGLIRVWAAINFGDDKLAPKRVLTFPDPDESRVREDFGKRNDAFLKALKSGRDAGGQLTQTYVDALAEKYGVPTLLLAPAPQLPAAPVTPAASPSRGGLTSAACASPAARAPFARSTPIARRAQFVVPERRHVETERPPEQPLPSRVRAHGLASRSAYACSAARLAVALSPASPSTAGTSGFTLKSNTSHRCPPLGFAHTTSHTSPTRACQRSSFSLSTNQRMRRALTAWLAAGRERPQ